MVSLEGNIPSFRITRDELFELVTHIQQRLISLSSPVRSISITLGNFTEDCDNVLELEAFLKDIFLPKVVKNAELSIRAKISIHLHMSRYSASYSVYNAVDTSEARSLEDIILTFFKKHSGFRLLNPIFQGFLIGASISAFIVITTTVIFSVIEGKFLLYREFYVFGAICIVTFWVYIIWSNSTSDTPSVSFFYSLIWIEEPKTKVQWAFVSTILVGLLISYLSSLLI